MSKEGKPQQQGKVEYLVTDLLQRDPEINTRLIDEKRAAKMAANLDLDALGIITASHRSDGKYVILDGQHRVEALRMFGWNGEKIPVKVFTGMTRAEESTMFITLNSQVAIRFIDRFLARVSAKDKVACAITEIARANGYVIDRTSRDGVIVAARALEDVYLGKNQKIRGENAKALHGTLHALTEAWGRTVHAMNAEVLAGVGAFLLRYGDTAKLTRLIEKMKSINGGPQGLVTRGKGKRELHGGTLAFGIGHYLTDEYNRGLRGKGTLPAWRE